METARNPDIITLSEDEECICPVKMSEGELAFVNVQDDDDDDDDDALTTEEELCLRQDTMREFFLQQLKVLRESVVSSQTKMQEHLKASREATDTNLKEELNHYTERLEAHIKTDLQMLEEHFKTAGHRVEEMVKAMGESMTKRMNDMDKKLKELTSRITAVEVEVYSMLASTSFVESTSPSVLTAHTAVDQPSEEAGPLSSTRVADEGGVTEISVDIESLPPLSLTGPSQDAVLTTTRYVESIADQPSEEAGPLSSTRVSDEGGVTEISVDIESLPPLSLTGPSQDAVLTTTRYVESIADQPSEEAGQLSSTRVADEGGVTEISVDIESLPPLSPTGPSQDAVLTTTRYVESIADQPSEEAGQLSSTRVADEGGVTEISVDIESLPPLSPTGPSQDAVLTTTRYVESIADQPSEEAGPLSSTRVSDEGGVTEISMDIESLPPLSPTGPSQDAVLTTTRYVESITDQPSEEAGQLSSTRVADEGGVTEISVDIESLPPLSPTGPSQDAVLTTTRYVESIADQPSEEAGPLSSTLVADEGGVTEISVDIQSLLLLCPTGPSQDAVLTTTRYVESIADQPSEEAGPLSSTRVADEGGVTEISVDIQSLLLLCPTGPSQDAVLTTTRYVESIADQPSEEAGPLSSTRVSDEGGVTEISVDIESLPPLSLTGPSQDAVLTTTRYVESIADQPSEEAGQLSSTRVSDEGGVTEISVDIESLPGSSGVQKWPISRKRKVAHSLEDLAPELAAKLRPYTKLRVTKQEKITGLQSAYFNFQMDRLKITDTKGLSDKAGVIKEAGERDGLWSPGWSPRGTKELRAYLGERIKTTLKRRKRTELVVQQEKDKLQQSFQD